MHNLANILLNLIAAIVVGGMITFIGVNWVSGCGEMFPRFDGSYESGQCVSIGEMVNMLLVRKEP